MVILKPIASNWSRSEREKLNNNWTIIENYLSNLQGQINLLTGDVNVQELIDQLNHLLSQSTLVLEELESALANIETIIMNAQNATDDANNAAQSALNAVNDIQSIIDNFQTKGTFDMETIYAKNNSVLYEGSSYIYINNTPSKGNPPPNYPIVSNDYWHMTAAKGASGEGAVSKVNGKEPNAEGEVILAPSDIGAASSTELETHSKEIATTEKLGHIKPDGSTITVDPETGVASASVGFQLTDGDSTKSTVSAWGGTAKNIDEIFEVGFYYTNKAFGTLGTLPNDSTSFQVLVLSYTNEQGTLTTPLQIAFSMPSSDEGAVYMRNFYGVSIGWSPWVRITQKLSDSLTLDRSDMGASSKAVKTLNDTKASIVQPGEQNITLQNGWIGAARYYKDTMGLVHVFLSISGGTKTKGTVLADLPVGYRPAWGFMPFIGATYVISDTSATAIALELTSGGRLTINHTAKDTIIAQFSYRTD